MILRGTVGLTVATRACLAVGEPSTDFVEELMAAALIVCGVALSIGIVTRLYSTLVGVSYAIALLAPLNGTLLLRVDTAAALVGVAAAIAVAILGPGAFSMDARLFGRREIFIPGKATYR